MQQAQIEALKQQYKGANEQVVDLKLSTSAARSALFSSQTTSFEDSWVYDRTTTRQMHAMYDYLRPVFSRAISTGELPEGTKPEDIWLDLAQES